MGFGGGGEQAVQKVERLDARKLTGDEKIVGSAVSRVAAGWPQKTRYPYRSRSGKLGQLDELAFERRRPHRRRRATSHRAKPPSSAACSSARDPGAPANQGMIRSWPSLPSEDDLTMALRIAAEQVDTWVASPQPARG